MGTELFPQGYIAMGNGDLVQVTDIKYTIKNNAKQVHTIRKKGAGISGGVEETTVTFNAVIGADGEEADWIKLVKSLAIKQLRIKIPGRTITVNGSFTEDAKDLPLDNPIVSGLSFIGHTEDD